MVSRKTQKRPKYEIVLQQIEKETRITLERVLKRHPEISSGTFYSTVNTLSKNNLVRKIRMPKRRLAYQKTKKYTIEKAREILKAHYRKRSDKYWPGPKQKLLPTNPLLTMSVYSLINALEFFHGVEERHRQATIILMDLAVEYALKAKLYQTDPVEFIKGQSGQLDFFAALREAKNNKDISREDEVKLTKVHQTRNYAQHRAVIPDSPSTKQYMIWTYKFIRRFFSRNFATDIKFHILPSLLHGLRI